jgi:hypothetical protein
MPEDRPSHDPGSAIGWIVLPGHTDVRARVEVVRCGRFARLRRTILLSVLSLVATAVAFVITIFDPFLSSIPLLVGGASAWRSLHGHYRVRSFEGDCPRCGEAIRLAAGSRIGSPHGLVCYTCHHEPELYLQG